MAKRFTETDKWKKITFRKLSINTKLLWFYILDNCSFAGIWEIDLDLASFQIGVQIDKKHLKELGDKFLYFEDNKLFIKEFIEFQYGKLSNSCNPHKRVIQQLQKYNLINKELSTNFKGSCTVLGTLLNRVEDKEEDKDKDKDKDKEEDKANKFNEIWSLYPKKLGKKNAYKIYSQLFKKDTLIKEKLIKAIKNYKIYIANNKIEDAYIKHGSTFFNNWEEYYDLKIEDIKERNKRIIEEMCKYDNN